MNAAELKEGDRIARELIAGYWDAFCGAGPARNYRFDHLRYLESDTWATREQWIAAARLCVENKTKLLFGLEILLAEGLDEYLPLAQDLIRDWDEQYEGHDPEYYYDLLAQLASDDPMRRKYLSGFDPFDLCTWGRKALILAVDEPGCGKIGAALSSMFTAAEPDANEIEHTGLPLLCDLGPLCGQYVTPAALEAARRFCLDYLARDRAIAPHYRQWYAEFSAGQRDERMHWIFGEIAPIASRLGWFDVLEGLQREPWYWEQLFAHAYSDYESTSLLAWSRHADNEVLRRRAMLVMTNNRFDTLDGAIAWTRMSGVRAG